MNAISNVLSKTMAINQVTKYIGILEAIVLASKDCQLISGKFKHLILSQDNTPEVY